MALGRTLAKKTLYVIIIWLVLPADQAYSRAVSAGISIPAPTTLASSSPTAEWTMLIYAQANNALSNFAHKNFSEVAAIGSNLNCNILVQWFQPGKTGVWRYKIEKNLMKLDMNIPSNSDGSAAEDLIDAMRWAATKYPAQKYCLVLWNHGTGVLDPHWGSGNSLFAVNPRVLWDNPRIQIEGLTVPEGFYAQAQKHHHKKYSHKHDHGTSVHRGILFNERTKTYMDNQTLTEALRQINGIIGKKIDVLGMDACLMAMLEVGYQVRQYAQYLVASQEVELAYGWHYFEVCQGLIAKQLSPSELAQLIVGSYERFYKTKIQFYTQSAVDLSKIAYLKNILHEIGQNLLACLSFDKKTFAPLVKKARSTCIQFSTPSYVDLYSFLTELENQIALTYDKKVQQRKIFNFSQALQTLRAGLKEGIYALQECVIANTAGKYLSQARGISIYFPQGHIDNSYQETDFAKECSWVKVVSEVM